MWIMLLTAWIVIVGMQHTVRRLSQIRFRINIYFSQTIYFYVQESKKVIRWHTSNWAKICLKIRKHNLTLRATYFIMHTLGKQANQQIPALWSLPDPQYITDTLILDLVELGSISEYRSFLASHSRLYERTLSFTLHLHHLFCPLITNAKWT